jgi:hypothetical protein
LKIKNAEQDKQYGVKTEEAVLLNRVVRVDFWGGGI